MAPSTTLDMSGLMEQLVAALNAGMAKVQQEVSGSEANNKAVEQKKLNFSAIRAQIVGTWLFLGHAEHHWPVDADEYYTMPEWPTRSPSTSIWTLFPPWL